MKAEKIEKLRIAISKIIAAPGLKGATRFKMVNILNTVDRGRRLPNPLQRIADQLVATLDEVNMTNGGKR
ncbi:hypothetical protein [Magnetospirillum sp. 15-1]|uniref:hypothetical protein n=1 Tax=Magnetospirillum sp. 15-1 TaxID=1979370 RepID=UPI001142E33D|nr:hypothetical protein [Magnetospirillum sp. 15-1]